VTVREKAVVGQLCCTIPTYPPPPLDQAARRAGAANGEEKTNTCNLWAMLITLGEDQCAVCQAVSTMGWGQESKKTAFGGEYWRQRLSQTCQWSSEFLFSIKQDT